MKRFPFGLQPVQESRARAPMSRRQCIRSKEIFATPS
jgi:hypothetical protein